MRMRAVQVLLVYICGVTLTGCPIGIGPSNANSLTLNNQNNRNIVEFSVSKTGPVPDGTKIDVPGINLLQEELPPGETFRVDGLADGEYSIRIVYRYVKILDNGTEQESIAGTYRTQVLEGGNDYNFYFRLTTSAGDASSIQAHSPLSLFWGYFAVEG